MIRIANASIFIAIAFGALTSGLPGFVRDTCIGPQSVNRPPLVKSFDASQATIEICANLPGKPANDRPELRLTTQASDPDGDRLKFRYSITAGRVIGSGASVVWDLKNVREGSYTATVQVKDSHGAVTSASTVVVIVDMMCPEVFCPQMLVSCPETIEEGKQAHFSLTLSMVAPEAKLIPEWSVSVGKFVHMDPLNIVVNTTGLAGKQIKGKVNLKGTPPFCAHKASCIVQVIGKL